MGDWIVVDGVRPYDGRYELELGDGGFTTREWGWLKRYAGVLPVTLDENTFSDPEVIAVMAIIAIRRNGSIDAGQVGEVWERLLDAPFGTTIRFEPGPAADEEEADADGPPARSSNGSEPSSGPGSRTSSESSDATPAASGMLASGSSASAPVKWGT